MSEPQQWAFLDTLQPKADETELDLARALDALVLVRAEAIKARDLGASSIVAYN